MISPWIALSAAVVLSTLSLPTLAAPNGPSTNHAASNGLAVGQDPKLLQITRDTNAGAGNGGEFYRSFSGVSGCSAHDMMSCMWQERDPGNSQTRNQSPECDLIKCEFNPGHGGAP